MNFMIVIIYNYADTYKFSLSNYMANKYYYVLQVMVVVYKNYCL